MFIFSVKASTIKVIALTLASLTALVVLITLIPQFTPTAANLMYTDVASYNFTKVRTNEERIEFLSQFGWVVEASPIETKEVTIPSEFDKVFVGYNDIQKQQGLDLSKYKTKEVTRYTYKVTNYPDSNETVLANILVYRGRVIGGDICSANADGFVLSLDGNAKLP